MDVVAVFDGHGGEEVSQIAAEYLAKHLSKKFQETRDLSSAVTQIFAAMNIACEEFRNNNSKRVGSTALVAILQKDQFCLANLGDCRAVLSKNGIAKRLSKDHKPLDFEERTQIKKGGGFVLETGRVNGVLAVARALGDFYLETPLNAQPDVEIKKIEPEDEFIILACDG